MDDGAKTEHEQSWPWVHDAEVTAKGSVKLGGSFVATIVTLNENVGVALISRRFDPRLKPSSSKRKVTIAVPTAPGVMENDREET